MNYRYQCSECSHDFELNLPIANRDIPLKKPCPKCGKKKISRFFENCAIVSESMHPIKKAGSGWNDVLKKISKYAGKHSTVEHY